MFNIRSIVSHVLLLSKAQLPQIGLDRGIPPCGFLVMLPPCWESSAIFSAKGSPSSWLRDAEEVRAFFRDLPTPAELQAMADRWVGVDDQAKRLADRNIRALTGMSLRLSTGSLVFLSAATAATG